LAASVEKWSNYTAFGSPMPGRNYQPATPYKYGFNGKENDKEVVGTGSGTQDYGARIYNPTLGKFLSVDPFVDKFPALSPYAFASNTPIMAIDRDGKYIFIVTKPENGDGKPIIKRATAADLKNVPGFEGLYKTKSGRKLLNKYMNSEKRDLYLTVKDIKGTKSGGDTWGQAIDPKVTKALTDKKGEFNPSEKIDELRGNGNGGAPYGLYEIEKNFRNFSGVPIREGTTESALIVVDPQYGLTDEQKVETAGHETLHIDLWEKGVPGGTHHDNQQFKDGLEQINKEYDAIPKPAPEAPKKEGE